METGRIQHGEEEVEDLETQGMQGMQEEMKPKTATTVERKDTFPKNVASPEKDARKESEKCKMETAMRCMKIIF